MSWVRNNSDDQGVSAGEKGRVGPRAKPVWGATAKHGGILSLGKGLLRDSLLLLPHGTPVKCRFITSLPFSCAVCFRNPALHTCVGMLLHSAPADVLALILFTSHKVIAFLLVRTVGFNCFPAMFRAVCPFLKTAPFPSWNQDVTGKVAK